MPVASVDQRVKTLIGDLIVQLQIANMKIDELQEELAAFKPAHPVKGKELKETALFNMTFEITMIFPGVFLVVADDGGVVGIFGNKADVDAACERYRKARTH